MVQISTAHYEGSFVDFEKLPPKDLPEFAFAGRSNVGKSSLINYFCKQSHLAHTSSQPGKTQTFNFYKINDAFYFVDLPGYGFAKVPQHLRKEWAERMMNYFENRKQLRCVCQLVDSRIPPQKIDIEFATACHQLNIPLAVIFTKADRKRKNEIAVNMQAYKEALEPTFNEPPTYFVTSSSDKSGAEDFLKWLKVEIAK